MNTYRLEYENSEYMDVITADTDEEAIQEAFNMEDEEKGIVFNVILLDSEYNEIKTIY